MERVAFIQRIVVILNLFQDNEPKPKKKWETTVQKMMGAIIIFMSLIKPSPNGFMLSPTEG